ncbi:MAG: hypothetical protein P8129_24785 [Anaerolineae bacterium]
MIPRLCSKWQQASILLLLILALLLAGCGAATPQAQPTASQAQPTASPEPPSEPPLSPLATPQGGAGVSVLPTPTTVPASAAPAGEQSAPDLVVLHTNDNWGETEPCG